MAKREVIGHTKLKRLCRTLKVPSYAAVGILESLWHLVARETPRGDIGKLCNTDIADAIDWEGDADVLIDALVSSGWIDKCDVHRLVIHDWHEHANDTTKKFIARNNLSFATPQVQCLEMSGNVATNPEMSGNVCLPLPLPLPIPLPNHNPLPEPSPETETKTTVKRFVKPSLSEIEAFMVERRWKNAKRQSNVFFDHYEANGWMVGKVKMKDWKATIRKWETPDKIEPEEQQWEEVY